MISVVARIGMEGVYTHMVVGSGCGPVSWISARNMVREMVVVTRDLKRWWRKWGVERVRFAIVVGGGVSR